MVLHIKNMVCDRCIAVVRQQLEQAGLQVQELALGVAQVGPDPSEDQLSAIAGSLEVLGFKLIDKDKDKLVEGIRNTVIELVHHADLPELQVNFSQLLAERLNKDYSYLSRLFSESEGITIERFIIQQKIEKVKELLQYNELNLNEIAWKLGYSSSSHLSNQFKSVTGQSPSQFKALAVQQRKPIDKV